MNLTFASLPVPNHKSLAHIKAQKKKSKTHTRGNRTPDCSTAALLPSFLFPPALPALPSELHRLPVTVRHTMHMVSQPYNTERCRGVDAPPELRRVCRQTSYYAKKHDPRACVSRTVTTVICISNQSQRTNPRAPLCSRASLASQRFRALLRHGCHTREPIRSLYHGVNTRLAPSSPARRSNNIYVRFYLLFLTAKATTLRWSTHWMTCTRPSRRCRSRQSSFSVSGL